MENIKFAGRGLGNRCYMQTYMTPIINIVLVSLLLITTFSCHDNKKDFETVQDSTKLIPGLIKPGSISTYSISEFDTTIKPIKVSLYQLNNMYKSLHGKFIETEGRFEYSFEHISISNTPSFDNRVIFFWLDV